MRPPRARWRSWPIVAAAIIGSLAAPWALAADEGSPGSPEPESLEAPEPMLAAFHRLVDDGQTEATRLAAAAELIDSDDADVAADLLAIALSERYASDTWRPTLKALALHETQPPETLVDPLLALSTRADASLRPPLAAALGRLVDDTLAERLLARAEARSRDAENPEPDDAGNNKLSTGARQTAVLALGHHRTQPTAGALVALTGPEHPAAIRDAAFVALETLTGVTRLGSDADAWADWWREAAELSSSEWDRAVLENLARRAERQRIAERQLAGRVQELVRSQYRATDSEQRGELLTRLLDDPLDPVRELAMDLSMQRLVGDGTFDEPLRAALRGRLDDRVPEIRRRAATLLRDLADGPAADRAAARLAEQGEPAVTVLRAKLLLLTRLPRGPAIEPVTQLLDHPALGAEAAAMLANAAEAGLVSPAQAEDILERVRWGVAGEAPKPQEVRLLGRLGREADWQRIIAWLDSDEPPVKQAAAHVWAESKRSLVPLADRAADPHIGPVFLRAAAQRGHSATTLTALLEHEPDPDEHADRHEQWQRALIGVAGRISPEAVLAAIDRLERLETEPALREAMLTAALDRFDELEAALAAADAAEAAEDNADGFDDGGAPADADADDENADQGDTGDAQRADATPRRVPGGMVHRPRLIDPLDPRATEPSLAIDIGDAGGAVDGTDGLLDANAGSLGADPARHRAALLLARAHVRLEAQRTTRAIEDLEAAAALGDALNDAQRSRLGRKRVRAHLMAEQFDRAIEHARQELDRALLERDDAVRIIELLLDAASTQLEAEQVEVAQRITAVVEDLAGSFADDEADAETIDRLAQLEGRIGDEAAQQRPDAEERATDTADADEPPDEPDDHPDEAPDDEQSADDPGDGPAPDDDADA